MATITGTADDDSLVGTAENDLIRGLEGADTLIGAEGDDILMPGEGSATIQGDAGNDFLDFSGIASGPLGIDLAAGTAVTASGDVVLVSGVEVVQGTSFADTIVGGDGGDYLIGQDGKDEVRGGAGDDTIEGSGAGDAGDSIDGGADRDEFSYYGGNDVSIDLAAGTTSSGAVLVSIEDAWGDAGNDLIRGSTDANRLRGWDGGDTLEGGDGADTLEGEGGDDTLDGGAGFDVAGFSGDRTEYVVTLHRDASGAATHVTVADTVADRDGTDTIRLGADGATVERLRFADGEAAVICFMPGTLVATPAGEVPVETLRRGDLVLTAEGREAPVVWMGRQTVSRRFADPVRVLPVRIEAGALGEGLPRRDLLVSPDHALFLDGVLVHAGALVNGTTVRRETDVPGRWTYWHVELADHALVLVEGVPAETFVDNAGRRAFDNWGEHLALYPEGRDIAEMPLPRAKSSRQVPRALRERLAAAAAKDAPPVPSAAA